jgi:hypothetical protein
MSRVPEHLGFAKSSDIERKKEREALTKSLTRGVAAKMADGKAIGALVDAKSAEDKAVDALACTDSLAPLAAMTLDFDSTNSVADCARVVMRSESLL